MIWLLFLLWLVASALALLMVFKSVYEEIDEIKLGDAAALLFLFLIGPFGLWIVMGEMYGKNSYKYPRAPKLNFVIWKRKK